MGFSPSSDQEQQTFTQGSLWLATLGLLFVDQFLVRFSSLAWTDFLSWRYWVNQLFSAVFIFGLIVLLGSYLSALRQRGRERLFRIVLVVNFIELFTLLALQVNHFLIYQKPFSSFSVRFVFENPLLLLELASENINLAQTLLRALPSAALLLFVLHRFSQRRAPSLTLNLCGGLALTASLAVGTFAWLAAPVMQHSLLSASVAFTDLLRAPNNFLGSNVIERRPFDRLNCAAPVAKTEIPSVIWVVGESLVSARLSLYGYERKTTEFLSAEWQAGRLVRFNNAVSIGTVTRVSVPYLFFGLQGPDHNGRLYRTPSIFDFAKSAGLKTAFIGAQELRWGNQDKIIINENVDYYRSGSDFDRNAGVSKGAEDFKVLSQGALPFLKKTREPFFLALHMDGSHYPFSTHSLPKYKKFLPELTANDDNAYDNTVVQFDAYMRELMQVVRAYHPNAWVFYSSDHGQNLDAQSRFNSGYAHNVIHNPLFAFAPQETLEKMELNAGAPVSQADLYASTLSAWGCPLPNHLRSDSFSLLGDIPEDRLRVVSGYMSSHLVDETAALILPNRQKIEVDFAKSAVTLPSGVVVPLSSWRSPLRLFLERNEKNGAGPELSEKEAIFRRAE